MIYTNSILPRLALFHFVARSVLAAMAAFCLVTQSLAQVPIIQPGPPGQPGRVITAEQASDLAGIQYSMGDIMFLQGMISHHAQAKEMSDLADDRTNTTAVLALAERINLSQDDEIAMMQGWLEDRDLDVPGADAHHAGDFELMPVC